MFGSLVGVIIGLVMSLVMSLVMLLASIGMVDGFLLIWLQSAALGFVISAPLSMIVVPLAEGLLGRVLRVQE